MKKILITCLYPTEANPMIAIAIAKAIRNMNSDVYALIEESTVNREQWISELGIDKVETVNINHPIGGLNKISKYINAAKFTLTPSAISLKKLSNVNFDYCLFTFYHHWNDMLFKKIKAKKRVLFLHDPIPHSGDSRKILDRQKKQAKVADDIVVLSRKFLSLVESEYELNRERIHYMPHGAMDYSQSQQSVHTSFDESRGINFLFFGRITAYKGIEILLKAFQMIQDEHCNNSLTIAGKGDFTKYQELVSENVTIINRYIDDSEIEVLFTKINTIAVLPYLDATQSGVIPIASKYGTPVIVSNTGGLVEQLSDGETGIFVEAGNVESLANAMKTVIENRGRLKEQSMAMLQFHEKLGWDTIIKNLMDDLEK